MTVPGSGRRERKRLVGGILREADLETSLARAFRLPLRQLIDPLCAHLPGLDGPLKWRAVSVLGAVVARLAEEERETARNVMRRLVWTLSDESGGIGWGAPEAMGEAMARSEAMADDFAHVLVAFLRPDGNQLEFEALHPAVLWGVGRLAHARPEHAADAAPHLPLYLRSPDPAIRGTAAWAAGPAPGRDGGSSGGAARRSRRVRALRGRCPDPRARRRRRRPLGRVAEPRRIALSRRPGRSLTRCRRTPGARACTSPKTSSSCPGRGTGHRPGSSRSNRRPRNSRRASTCASRRRRARRVPRRSSRSSPSFPRRFWWPRRSRRGTSRRRRSSAPPPTGTSRILPPRVRRTVRAGRPRPPRLRRTSPPRGTSRRRGCRSRRRPRRRARRALGGVARIVVRGHPPRPRRRPDPRRDRWVSRVRPGGSSAVAQAAGRSSASSKATWNRSVTRASSACVRRVARRAPGR